MQITSGSMTYARTVNLGDYNSKKVEFTLAFSIDESESVDECLDRVAALAWEKTTEALTISATSKAAARAPIEHVVSAEAPRPDPAKRGPGRPPKVQAAPAAPPLAVETPKPAEAAPAAPPLAVETPKPAEAAPVEQTADPDMDSLEAMLGADEPAAEDVTDAMLNVAVRDHQIQTMNGPAIRKMLEKHGVKLPNKISSMPASGRAAFLKELVTVKPLA